MLSEFSIFSKIKRIVSNFGCEFPECGLHSGAVSARHLVEQGLESFPMVHLHRMAQFVKNNETHQLRRKEHHVARQRNPSCRRAATPFSGSRGYRHARHLESPACGFLSQHGREQPLRIASQHHPDSIAKRRLPLRRLTVEACRTKERSRLSAARHPEAGIPMAAFCY